MLNSETLRSSPKHESYIAKIFNYNASQKLGILKDKYYFMIAKSLQSVKSESPLRIDNTKKKNKVVFKTEMDENKTIQAGFQTQRKSYDCVANKNFNLISNMFELEQKNLDLYMELQEKNTIIQQLQLQVQSCKSEQAEQKRLFSQEKKELLNKVKSLGKQCEQQRSYIDQLPSFEVEAQEWKSRFLKLNKQFHQSQEILYRMEAEQQTNQRRKADAFNYLK